MKAKQAEMKQLENIKKLREAEQRNKEISEMLLKEA
jgi:hypothetical protein